MRAQQPVELAWDEIPLHTQLDVLIYDMIEADTGLLSRAGHASTPVTFAPGTGTEKANLE